MRPKMSTKVSMSVYVDKAIVDAIDQNSTGLNRSQATERLLALALYGLSQKNAMDKYLEGE